MNFPVEGEDIETILETLEDMKASDARWREGRTFGMIFDGGPQVHEVTERAAALYLHENGLSTRNFPSIGKIQADVVAWVNDLAHGPAKAAGFLTSGGTESIMLGVLAAREKARVERGVEKGEIVLSRSAHAAFHKAAHMFDLKVRMSEVRGDYSADPAAMAADINDNTVIICASAPQYPQGVMDPIPEIGALAEEAGVNLHIDACMGGLFLPFAEALGRDVPPWDFRVPGVSSISMDMHKLGYAPKGVSVNLHRTEKNRDYQTFVHDEWLGGLYGSPGIQGTRSAAPMAAAWAVIKFLGHEGYAKMVARNLENADRMREAIASIDGLGIMGDSHFHVMAMTADEGSNDPLDVFALADALTARGWTHDRQGPPDAIHITVSNTNRDVMDQYISDLEACASECRGKRAADRSTSYATVE